MARQLEINYIDGSNDIINLTLFDSAQAEQHLQAKGMGSVQQSPIRFSAFAAYCNLRKNGKTAGKNFEEWMESVSDLQEVTPDENTDPLA